VALKVDSSFLKFVTMGALGARRVCELMARAGLQPIELERYSRSNKIWSTKVKRLRLPDLLCVRTGLRVEVRAKSKLTIKMSDAPTNPDRRWNTGFALRDMIAFVLIHEAEDGTLHAADNAELFWVENLQATEDDSRLGPPKSASEGAERDREWPSIVATTSGVVQAIDDTRISTRLEGGRNQTYQLRGKTAYFAAGQPFLAESQFLAGLPAAKAAFPDPRQVRWNPRDMLRSDSPIDRYVALKALGAVGGARDLPAISSIAEHDPEDRVALEAAASLARLGSDHGLELLRAAIDAPQVPFLRMEGVLALSELHGTPLAIRCADLLTEYAQAEAFVGDEVRQAAIWGLGKDGLRAYARLLAFLDAPTDEELVHAVCAFGPDADAALADQLVGVLADQAAPERKRASASFVLARTIQAHLSAPRLVALRTHAFAVTRDWALATLGQMSPAAIQHYVNDRALAAQLRPLQLTSPETNWTRSEQITDMLTFVRKQTVEAPA
jgi:hypothetical protein